ncbi:MAG TPA: hypothetical protein PKM27_15255 [Saprospiraceae bacterium]|nr:hypothetical protein [Saprospiraceae bacterium]HNT22286.1 hypothetical protein [Saprospiraceae bacterium]
MKEISNDTPFTAGSRNQGRIGHAVQAIKDPENQSGPSFALLGSNDAADRIRAELFELADHFPLSNLIDLGNLRDGDPQEGPALFQSLFNAGIIPVFIASDPGDFELHLKASLRHSMVSSWAAVHPSLLSDYPGRNSVFEAAESGNASFKFIGHQLHITPAEQIEKTARLGLNSMRLGQVRQHIDAVEPWFRSLDHVLFDLDALRRTDFPSKKSINPGGFFYEEACKICQFSGASSHLKSFGLYGYDPLSDTDGNGAAVAAQLIWYLFEGFNNHREEKAIQKSKMTQYIVHNPQNGKDIHFWKSNQSGRWWLEIPDHEDHWISCTYDDYNAASKGAYSSRIVSVLNLD